MGKSIVRLDFKLFIEINAVSIGLMKINSNWDYKTAHKNLNIFN